jgi:hypothetical protein
LTDLEKIAILDIVSVHRIIFGVWFGVDVFRRRAFSKSYPLFPELFIILANYRASCIPQKGGGVVHIVGRE